MMIEKSDSKLSDEELVNLVFISGKENFEILISRYSTKLFNYLLRLLNFNHSDTQDALSDTFLKAYRSLYSFNSKLKFSSWIYRIAHNQAIDMIRKRKYKIVDLNENLHHFKIGSDFSESKKDDLEKLLQLINEKDKNLLVLFYLEEKSITEIAQILKLKPQTVSVQLFRAKNRAQETIKKYLM